MIYFCCDLDNTLIYSYRHDIGEDKVLVETKEGKELSFISTVSLSLLRKVAEDKTLVPLTTRSLEQYSRIDFGSQVPIKYALAVNGGVLLEDGKVNEEWFRESKRMASYAQKEMDQGMELLRQDENVCFEIRKVDELFVFTKSNDVPATLEMLKTNLDLDVVYVDSNGSKVYITPAKLNKGSSLKRFREYVGTEHKILAAGDSDFDIPMLLAADTGYCPEDLLKKMQELEREPIEHIVGFPKEMFCEEMLRSVLKEPQKKVREFYESKKYKHQGF
ncbi:MAG: HAD hydrolase family protein [Lachnospiraceae bacterium]|nr:HAD hydrolase family protein [Lachnospiraceae bacterium]